MAGYNIYKHQTTVFYIDILYHHETKIWQTSKNTNKQTSHFGWFLTCYKQYLKYLNKFSA